MSTFEQYVREQIGTRPTFAKGQYAPECRAWDARYVALLNGGVDVGLPIYHPRRLRTEKTEASHAAE